MEYVNRHDRQNVKMEISGYILDQENKQPVQFATVQVYLNGSLKRSTIADMYGGFFIEAEPGSNIKFSQAEYFTKSFAANDLNEGMIAVDWINIGLQAKNNSLQAVTVTSHKKKNKNWLIVAALAAVVIANKKGKSIGATQNKINPNTVLYIGGGLLGYSIINKILVSLGIWEGKGSKNVTKAQTDPNSCWKPFFWKTAATPGTVILLISDDVAVSMSKTIYNAFHVFQDDFSAIFGVFARLKTKTQVSYLSMKFQEKYNIDLLTFLTNGGGILPWDGLSETQLEKLTTFVSNLKNY